MRELHELTGGNAADEGLLCAESDMEAAVASLTGQSRVSNLRSGKKCRNIRQALGAGGRDVRIGSEIGLERFETQPSSTQMGSSGFLLIFAALSYRWHWKWMIDNLVSVVLVLVLLKYYKKMNISLVPYSLLMIFLVLHNLGSFGLYAQFPFGIEYDIYVHLFFGFAFGIAAGKPIAENAVALGTLSLWMNSPVFILIMAGGFTTNLIWCVILNVRNRTGKDYLNSKDASLFTNYLFSSLAGIIWYFQFMFYGMGTTKMGKYDFSSWSIHMAFIIVFSNIWGLIFKEWKGSSPRTLSIIVSGILVLIVSTCIIGLGNFLALPGK